MSYNPVDIDTYQAVLKRAELAERLHAESDRVRTGLAIKLEQAERALALVQCCDDEPCSSCVACLQRTVEISNEKIATLRATLEEKDELIASMEAKLWIDGVQVSTGKLRELYEDLRATLAEYEIGLADRDGMIQRLERGRCDGAGKTGHDVASCFPCQLATSRATLARVEEKALFWNQAANSAMAEADGLREERLRIDQARSLLEMERTALAESLADSITQADGLRAALRWMDEYVVPPEFPNEGDQQYWEELRAHYAALGRPVNNDPTGGV